MKKQAPIVFWDFEIDEEKKVAYKVADPKSQDVLPERDKKRDLNIE